MSIRPFRAAIAAWAALLCAVSAATAETGYAPMQPFEAYAGRTWRAEATDDRGKPIVDVSHWEFILGGRALQITHSINDGDYGGRTILFYDEGARGYIFHYFTNAGFHTSGTATVDGNRMVSTETVSGHKDIAEVRATAILGEGEMKVASEYVQKDGTVKPGHSFHYKEAPDAKVIFH